jgi:hypothetical protein
LDVKTTTQNKTITWKIDRAIVAPHLGLSMHQGWPYAPYQEMIVTLPYAARASVLFLALAVLTLLICTTEVRLPSLALLAGLFTVPFWVLISGGIPHPAWVNSAQFAGYQAKMLPVIAILPVVLAFFVLRKIPRLPLVLILLLLALAAGGYPLIGLLDEPKRKSLETFIQAGMIAYVFGLTLVVRLSRMRKTRE